MNGRDPGLQPERTALAWRRTALATLINALLLARMGWTARQGMLITLAAVLLLLTLAIAVAGAVRQSALSRRPDAACMPCALPAVTAGATFLAACGAAVGLLQQAVGPEGITAP